MQQPFHPGIKSDGDGESDERKPTKQVIFRKQLQRSNEVFTKGSTFYMNYENHRQGGIKHLDTEIQSKSTNTNCARPRVTLQSCLAEHG